MKKIAVSIAALGLTLIGCSNGGGITPSVSTALTNTKSKLTTLVPNTSNVSATALEERGSLSVWTTGGNQYAHGGDFGASPRAYVRNLGDSSKQSMLMMRLEQALQNLCIFSTALPSENGAPTLTAATTVTLTAEVKANIVSTCNVALSTMPADGTVVGYEVTDISSEAGSQYERLVKFDMTGGTNWQNYFRYTITSTLSRMHYVEDSTNDSAAFFEYNASTEKFKFEFSEEAPGNFKLHYRGILLETSNLGRFVAIIKRNSDYSTAVVSIKEGAGSEVHTSYSFDDDANANDFTDGSACINASTFAISSDNTETCSNGAITGVLASSYTKGVDTVTSAYVTGLDNSAVMQFEDLADILTANMAGL